MADAKLAAPPLPFADSTLGADFIAQLTDLWERLTLEQQIKLAAVLAVIKEHDAAIRVTVGNMKGGVAKSTTSIFFALLLAFTGEEVLLVDGDKKNTSCLKWKLGAEGDWPLNVQVQPWATPDLAPRVQAMRGQVKHVVADTSPQIEEVLRAALMVTDTFLIVTQPNPMDVLQLEDSINVAVETDQQKRVLGGELAAVIAFMRVKQQNSILLRDARKHADDNDFPYLWTAVLSRDPIAEMFGTFPWNFAEYIDLFAEFVAYALGLDYIPGETADEQVEENA
ncbi:AAA family ATPase [Actinomadura yumaensis]|uniref:AAA family ATPase n=1 Tax=Actinomadura yumaensis TaxID=111807 RepID=A0ABW2CQJ5_9ACTN